VLHPLHLLQTPAESYELFRQAIIRCITVVYMVRALIWCISIVYMVKALISCISIVYMVKALIWCISIVYMVKALIWCIRIVYMVKALIWSISIYNALLSVKPKSTAACGAEVTQYSAPLYFLARNNWGAPCAGQTWVCSIV